MKPPALRALPALAGIGTGGRVNIVLASPDGRFILMREIDPSGRIWLVGRHPSLAPAWRIGSAESYVVRAESGLVLAWSGGRILGCIVTR